MRNKRLIITSVISIVLVSILLIGSTYSIFTTTEVQEDLNVYKTGNLDITYTVTNDNTVMTNSVPIKSDDSIKIKPYRVTVINNGNVAYKFNIILNDTTASNSINHNYIMTQVGKLEPKALGLVDNNIIKGDTIVLPGSSVNIDVRVWISDSISNSEMGKSFYAKLSIDGIATITDIEEDIDNSILEAYHYDNYCVDNKITKLSDCLLMSEGYYSDVETAKMDLSKKIANFNNTAPIIKYTSRMETNVTNSNGVISTSNKIGVSDSFSFNEDTGYYELKNPVSYNMTDKLSTSTNKYYSCLGNCSTMYVIYNAIKQSYDDYEGMTFFKATEVDRYTSSFYEGNNSEKGIYMTKDDYGDSYYYRGKIDNNYVSFANFIWRIVRINGDGSIRLLYSGKSTSDTGDNVTIGLSHFNNDIHDAAMVGYKYGLSKSRQTTTATNLYFADIAAPTVYYFADDYTEDVEAKKFYLSGNIVSGTLTDVWQNGSPYKYTCFARGRNSSCTNLIEIDSYVSETRVKVRKYHSYLSESYESTYTDEYDSVIKTKIDSWYKTNIEDKGYTKYLADNMFCNDRSLVRGDGFSLNKTTIYGAVDRNIENKSPSLKCPRKVDQFTVGTGSVLGNGELTYPVGLLTADEAAFAGGKRGSRNQMFYLYTGKHWWLGSPGQFDMVSAAASAWHVFDDGEIPQWYWVTSNYGVRPVINLKANTVIASGNGTSQNPYIIVT